MDSISQRLHAVVPGRIPTRFEILDGFARVLGVNLHAPRLTGLTICRLEICLRSILGSAIPTF